MNLSMTPTASASKNSGKPMRSTSTSALRTYSGGELHARVMQTDSKEVAEMMREVMRKGRNRNLLSVATRGEHGERPRQDSHGLDSHTNI